MICQGKSKLLVGHKKKTGKESECDGGKKTDQRRQPELMAQEDGGDKAPSTQKSSQQA